MTIQTDEQLRQALEQVQRLYEALAALRADILQRNPTKFEILAEGTVDHIRQLQEAIDAYAGTKFVTEAQAPLWLRVAGPQVQWPEAPTSVLTEFLDALRKGVLTTAEMLAIGSLSTRPSSELRRACDLQIVAFAAGSLRVGLQLPEPNENIVRVQDAEVAARAMSTYLEAAAWATSEDAENVLAGVIPDGDLRRVVLSEVSRLVPRQRGLVHEVELSGRAIPTRGGVLLTRNSRDRIVAAIAGAIIEQREEHEGVLVEIDLDRLSFRISPQGAPDVSCEFGEEWTEVAKQGLDKPVRVIGTRVARFGRRRPFLQVRHMEIVEEEDAEPGGMS